MPHFNPSDHADELHAILDGLPDPWAAARACFLAVEMLGRFEQLHAEFDRLDGDGEVCMRHLFVAVSAIFAETRGFDSAWNGVVSWLSDQVEDESKGIIEAVVERYAPPEIDESLVASLRSMPYRDYLQTSHWQGLRELALVHAQRRCQLCNSPWDLQVHHRTYESRGKEPLSDLIVLCADCHGRFHDKLADAPA